MYPAYSFPATVAPRRGSRSVTQSWSASDASFEDRRGTHTVIDR